MNSQSEILDIIKMIHFDCCSEDSLLKEWKLVAIEQKNNCNFDVVSDHDLFLKRLKLYFDESAKNDIHVEMCQDRVFFVEVLNLFDTLKEKIKLNLEQTIGQKIIIEKLKEDGIAIYRSLYSENELGHLIKFQDKVTKFLEKQLSEHSCYIGLNVDPNTSQVSSLSTSKTPKNNGMSRLQSKSMGFFHPGLECVFEDEKINNVFRSWYKNKDAKFTRATMDWVYPAEFNHNGWHFDVLRDQLKAMILLSDVTFENAPMYYANKTHRYSDKLVIESKHNLFLNGLSKKLSKNHDGAPCSVSYFSEKAVNNAPQTIDQSDIVIDNHAYKKTVCTGKIGDVILFESNGFHSGNLCFSGVRKDIVLTVDSDLSFKNKFFDWMSTTKRFDC